MAEQEIVICPQCGEAKQNIGNHWRLSSSCEYPLPTSRQNEIIEGLLFSGGNINRNQGGRNSQLQTTSTNEPFLEWLDDEFGILGRGVNIHGDIEELSQTLRQYARPGDAGAEVTSDKNIYVWMTRNLPFLDDYETRWYEGRSAPDSSNASKNQKSAPDDLAPTPLMLKVTYAKRGQLYTVDSGKLIAVITISNIPASTEQCERLLSPFNPRFIEHKSTNVEQFHLYDSRSFFEYIGWTPIPGYEDKWPAPDDPVSPLDSERWEVCPSCEKEYAALGAHWATSDCDFPDFPQTARELLEGILAVGSGLNQTNTSRQNMSIRSTNKPLLEYLKSELGIFATDIYMEESAERDSEMSFPKSWGVPPEAGFKDVYRLSTRTHPVFSELYESWYYNGTKQLPEDFRVTKHVLRGMYLYRGTLQEQQGESYPVISVTRSPEGIGLADHLSKFAPKPLKRENSERLLFKDTDRFFEYIGSAPEGLTEKWPDK